MLLYIMRHSQTDWNTKGRLQGRSDTELNEYGEELARKTGQAMREIHFDLAFSSPLKRAVRTAQLILEGQSVEIIPDPRIIEISFGTNEGYVGRGERMNIPDPNFHYFFDKPSVYVPAPGGETIDALCERTEEFLDDITHRPELEDKTILITTHGAALRGLLNGVKKRPRDDFWNGAVMENCHVSIIKSTGGTMELVKENISFCNEE